MAIDGSLVLLNHAAVDSGNDGNGTGADPTAPPGAEIALPTNFGGMAGVVLFLGEPSSDPPADAATLDVSVEISVDGGTTWDTWVAFRRFLGSEVNLIDESTGSVTVRRAQIANIPRPDAASTVHIRPVTVASTTTNWKIYCAIVDPNEIRDEWLYDSIAN